MDRVKTVLLIEQNKEIRENITEFLEQADYKVLSAGNGEDAVTQATGVDLDLIVCDIMIPAMDGYGVILMLQRHIETRDTPLIFLTTKTERTKVGKGMDLVANDYLTKPINGIALLKVIDRRLNKIDMPGEEQNTITKLNTLIKTVSGKDAMSELTKNRLLRKYKTKQVLYFEGDTPNKLFYIETGKIKTFKATEDGKELIVGLHNAGEFIGYTALLDGMIYHDTAEAIEECKIAAIPKKEFDELIYSNHDVLLEFVHLLADKVGDNGDQLLNIAYNSTRKKVAEVLIAFSNKYKGVTENQFTMNITRVNLANMAGVAKESLIRTLSIFKDEHIIEINGSDIVIIDEEKLINMAN